MEGSPLDLTAGNMAAFSLTLFGGIDLAVEAVLVQSCRADAERGGDTAYVKRFCGMSFGYCQVFTKALPQIITSTLRAGERSLFYKNRKGAQMGDLFMSLIHTCELNGADPFDYLNQLQRHVPKDQND